MGEVMSDKYLISYRMEDSEACGWYKMEICDDPVEWAISVRILKKQRMEFTILNILPMTKEQADRWEDYRQ